MSNFYQVLQHIASLSDILGRNSQRVLMQPYVISVGRETGLRDARIDLRIAPNMQLKPDVVAIGHERYEIARATPSGHSDVCAAIVQCEIGTEGAGVGR